MPENEKPPARLVDNYSYYFINKIYESGTQKTMKIYVKHFHKKGDYSCLEIKK